jgi:hypothetical protein
MSQSISTTVNCMRIATSVWIDHVEHGLPILQNAVDPSYDDLQCKKEKLRK